MDINFTSPLLSYIYNILRFSVVFDYRPRQPQPEGRIDRCCIGIPRNPHSTLAE